MGLATYGTGVRASPSVPLGNCDLSLNLPKLCANASSVDAMLVFVELFRSKNPIYNMIFLNIKSACFGGLRPKEKTV